MKKNSSKKLLFLAKSTNDLDSNLSVKKVKRKNKSEIFSFSEKAFLVFLHKIVFLREMLSFLPTLQKWRHQEGLLLKHFDQIYQSTNKLYWFRNLCTVPIPKIIPPCLLKFDDVLRNAIKMKSSFANDPLITSNPVVNFCFIQQHWEIEKPINKTLSGVFFHSTMFFTNNNSKRKQTNRTETWVFAKNMKKNTASVEKTGRQKITWHRKKITWQPAKLFIHKSMTNNQWKISMIAYAQRAHFHENFLKSSKIISKAWDFAQKLETFTLFGIVRLSRQNGSFHWSSSSSFGKGRLSSKSFVQDRQPSASKIPKFEVTHTSKD